MGSQTKRRRKRVAAKDDIQKFLVENFDWYTDEMYLMNCPSHKGHEMKNGEFADAWNGKYGGGETYNGKILTFTFCLDKKIRIFICGDYLSITDNRYAGRFDVWEYTNKPISTAGSLYKSYIHRLEPEKIEKILKTNISSRAWDIVKQRARELYVQRN